VSVEETGLLGCCAVLLGNLFPRLKKLPLSQGYESVHGFTILEMRMVHSFEMTNNAKTQKTWFLNMNIGLQLIMSSSFVPLPVGSTAIVPNNQGSDKWCAGRLLWFMNISAV
jgi:hypothetical protein